MELLNTIGFVWDSHEVSWREKFAALMRYQRVNGDCNVSSANCEDKKLATWVKCQRRQYKLYCDKRGSSMTNERIEELNKIGFSWEIRTLAPRKKPGKGRCPKQTSPPSMGNDGFAAQKA